MKKNFKDHCIDTCLNLFQSMPSIDRIRLNYIIFKKKITFSSSIFEINTEFIPVILQPPSFRFFDRY